MQKVETHWPKHVGCTGFREFAEAGCVECRFHDTFFASVHLCPSSVVFQCRNKTNSFSRQHDFMTLPALL